MQTFTFSLPTRVLFGAGTVESVGQEAACLGRHALLVTGTTFARRSGLIDRLRGSLSDAGVTVTLYDRIDPNPRVETIDEGGRIAREGGSEFVLGLGGGSALDAAKAIAAAARARHSVWDFTHHEMNGEPTPIAEALPIMQIPLIASTGSETNDTAVVFDEPSRCKASIVSPHLYARVAIVDPTLTFTVPPHYTAVGAMNILSQLLERYLTGDEFSATDRIAEGLVRVIMDNLPRAMRRGEDLDARSSLSWVAVLASTVAVAGRGASMPLLAMAHPIGAHFKVEHGRVVTALWPSYMRYALGNRFRLPQIGRFKRYALLGRQIFGVHETDDEVAAETTSFRLLNWLRGMDMPTDLTQLGIESIEPAELAQLTDQAVVVWGNGRQLPGGLTAEDVENIYQGALRPA